MNNELNNRLQQIINEAQKNKEAKIKTLASSQTLQFGTPYVAVCKDADVEVYDEKVRYVVSFQVFNTSFGTEWTERYYEYGTGLMYFNALCDVMETRNLGEFIGQAVIVVLENDGKYTNLRVKALCPEDDLQKEYARLAKADEEAGLVDPKTYIRDVRAEIQNKCNRLLQEVDELTSDSNADSELDNLMDDDDF